MSLRLKTLLQRSVTALTALRADPRFKRIGRVLGIGLIGLSFVFIALLIARSWGEVRPYLVQMSWAAIGWAAATTFVALVLGGVMWFLVQRAVGIPAGWSTSIAVHLISNITKYAPGLAWQYVSKGYLTQRQGVSARRNLLALLTEFILLLGGGTVAGSLAAWQLGEIPIGAWIAPRWIWLVCAVAAAAVIVGWYVALGRSFADPIYQPHGIAYLSALAVGAIGWIFFAASVWFLVGTLVPVTLATMLYCLFALVFAGTISILIVFVPGGFGIREASLAVLLAGVLPIPLGVIVGILLRLILMACEIVGFGLALVLFRGSTSGILPPYPVWGRRKNTPDEVLPQADR